MEGEGRKDYITTVPSPGAQWENQDDHRPPDYHVGEKVSGLSLQVGGWPSASEMTVGHFLLTRAPWKFYYAKQLKDCQKIGYWSEEAGKNAKKALKDNK